MISQPAFVSPPPVSVSDSLLIALFIAAVFHLMVILGVNFTVAKPQKINRSIAITIVNTDSRKAPEKAEYLAQSNQIGAGEQQKKPKPAAQKLPGRGESRKKPPKKVVTKSKPRQAQKIITQSTADTKVNAAEQSTTVVRDDLPELSTDSLVKQIAQLGAQIRYSQQSSQQSRIKFVNSVSAHKYQAAQYILDWQRKVERTGNMNYPEVARKKHFSGSLTMDVGIKHDGSIYSIRINKSSGMKALDDAAIRIVRMSAPFAPLPQELRKELDVLVITRVWQFSDESGMSSR